MRDSAGADFGPASVAAAAVFGLAALVTLVGLTSDVGATASSAAPVSHNLAADGIVANPDDDAGLIAANREQGNLGQTLLQQDPLDQITAACGSFNPYFVTSNFVRVGSGRGFPDEPAIIAFRDTPNDIADRITLATNGEVGAVFGLAYDPARARLYAAAYNKRSTSFGPAGTGGIYVIDLQTGTVSELARLFGGRDTHDYIRQEDQPAASMVGRNSLADIDLSEDGTTLFVTSLAENRIYRLDALTGAELGSFRHGAAGRDWERNARPFALHVKDGWVYHGLVDSGEFNGIGGSLTGYVFRSMPDGSQMEELARFDLDYPHMLPWVTWNNGPAEFPGSGAYIQLDGQPMLTDIESTDDGHLVLGLRDRVVDMIPTLDRRASTLPGRGALAPGTGAGDILPMRRAGDLWAVITDPEHYGDQTLVDESPLGGLAAFTGFDMLVSSARDPLRTRTVGALWSWNRTGAVGRWETIQTTSADQSGIGGTSNGLGDVEALCPPGEPDPDAVPTATAFAATATVNAAETATVAAQSPTPMFPVTPEHFPTELAEACEGENPYLATVCYPPTNLVQFQFDADNVVIFRDTPLNNPIYGAARVSGVGTVWGLTFRRKTGELFAAAYQKRLTEFGPAGPGAVYAIDTENGNVRTFAVLEAGADVHGNPTGGDQMARDEVGKLSLGDVEVDSEQNTLFVVNLFDRMIYAFDLDTGDELARFEHGAASESWSDWARPFGLGYHEGKLYHGVVNSAERTQGRDDLAAVVYESNNDGSEMREVARFPLTYARGEIQILGVLGQPAQQVPLDWLPWRGGENDISGGKAQTALYPQPMLSDIVFESDGTMVVAIKDRHSDMSLAFQIQQGARITKPGMGLGDVLRLAPNGDEWLPPTGSLPYRLPSTSHSERAAMGGLARFDPFDNTHLNWVEMVVNPTFGGVISTEGVLWYDQNQNLTRQEMTCTSRIFPRATPAPFARSWDGAAPLAGGFGLEAEAPVNDLSGSQLGMRESSGLVGQSVPNHSEWVPGKGMGDLEVLCGPFSTPTPTSTATRRPTNAPSPTPTPTSTAEPEPIYLPVLPNESCEDRKLHADVVLIIDVSTSMARATSAGRQKLEAAQEAARVFLSLMDFDPDGGRDQVAIVGFNDSAWVHHELSSSAAELMEAVDSLPERMSQGTRLDLALERGMEPLDAAGRLPDNTPVLVLLTDGLPNRVPTPEPSGSQEQTVMAIAGIAKTRGYVVFTVGVGSPDAPDISDRINVELLRGVASQPDNFYHAPDAEQLAEIYEQVAQTLRCPRGRHDWGAAWP